MNSIQRLNTTQQLVIDIYEHQNYRHRCPNETIGMLAKIDSDKIPHFIIGTLTATPYEYEKLMSVWCRLELMNEQKRST